MRIKSIITALFTASAFAQINAGVAGCDKSSMTETQSIRQPIQTDSIDLDCIIDFNFSLEGCGNGIFKVKLILNDSTALIKAKTSAHSSNNEDITVILKKMTTDCLRIFLYDLYSTHNTVVKEKYINERLLRFSETSQWHIDLTLNGKRITESFNIYDYWVSFEDPFNYQFDRIRQLIYAITNKIERDILQLKEVKPKEAEWIKEMFRDEFYQ